MAWDWKKSLADVLAAHRKTAACGGKAVSFATQQARQEILWQGFQQLRDLGHRLPDVRGFKGRHLMALAQTWEASGLSAATLQNRISVFRTFADWIGKPGMVLGAEYYVRNPQRVRRHSAARTDKTWSGQQQYLTDKLPGIREQDAFVAAQLALQRAFGLRMREAALLKPHAADKGAYLAVNWGTKGGRDRAIPIQTDAQREALAHAKALVTHPVHSLVPAHYSFRQWKDHYYYVCQSHGICRQAGITSHGLRHERLNEIYKTMTGCPSPVKQEPGSAALRQPDPAQEALARQEVAEVAGHSRAAIASAYLGSHHSNRLY